MKTLFLLLVLFATPSFAAEQCQIMPDGSVICYPIGGGKSIYGE